METIALAIIGVGFYHTGVIKNDRIDTVLGIIVILMTLSVIFFK